MSLQQTKDDLAIAFRVFECMADGPIEAGDYVVVTLPPTWSMQAHDEWYQPTSERVDDRHLELAGRMADTPLEDWKAAGLC